MISILNLFLHVVLTCNGSASGIAWLVGWLVNDELSIDVDGSGHGLIRGTDPSCAWRGCRILQRICQNGLNTGLNVNPGSAEYEAM